MRRLIRRAGRRGAFLAFLAILDLAYGYSLLGGDAAAFGRLDLLLPLPVWGWTWTGVGVICAAGIFSSRDRVAFACAAALKGAWSLLFADVWLLQGSPRGWVSVIVWGAFALVVLLIAGWPEPLRLPPPPEFAGQP